MGHIAAAGLAAHACLPLLAGSALALTGPLARRWWMLPAGASALALSIVVAPNFSQVYVYGPMMATSGAVLMVAGAALGSRWLELAPLRFTGRISYALYLWHLPLLRLNGTAFTGAAAIPSIVMSVIIAVGSTLVIEEPLRRAWRRRRGPGAKQSTASGHRGDRRYRHAGARAPIST